jgi:hypothetical protein
MNFKVISNAVIVGAAIIVFGTSTTAQTRVGTIQGLVKDPNGAVVAGATITLTQSITGYRQTTTTDAVGAFRLVNVPFNIYKIRIESKGFQPEDESVDLETALPMNLDIALTISGVADEVNVTESTLVETDKTSSDTDINQTIIERQVGAAPSRGMEAIVATAPGFATDDNGRLHPRGSESQVQYVIDGVPVTDNLSAIFSTSLDARTLRTVEVLTGGIPAEFGDKLGGVVSVNTRSGLEMPTQGGVTFSGGSFSTGEIGADFSTHTKKFGILANVSASTSQRFLDPLTIENFQNFGRTGKGFFRLDYRFDDNNSIRGTFLFGGSNFQIPTRFNQQMAGQNQGQHQRDSSQFITFEHIFSTTTLGQFSFFNRRSSSSLFSNPSSTPVVAFQDRSVQNYGVIASLSLTRGIHNLKLGTQFTRTPVREDFRFYPTVAFPDLVDVNGNTVPNPVNAFNVVNPFHFFQKQSGRAFNFYVQDRFTPFKNFTIDVGLRYDNYKLLIASDAISPRVGVAYYMPRSQTTLRASYNRLFQYPAAENLLLASSDQAAALSPIAVLQGQTGARPILADKQNVFEVGAQQQASRFFRLNLSVYQKRITNFGDKDQFFDTGVIFPITISSGRVTGEELRIESSEIHGFHGYVSYANARAYGVTPINGGLFLGDAVGGFNNPGLKFANDHDERNSAQFQFAYNHRRSGMYAMFGGRYDSGYPTDVEPGTTLADFIAQGFDARLFDLIDFQRGRVRPRTIFDLSVGADLLRKERTSINVQFDVRNLTNKRFLYNFESVFSGTHIGYPRLFSGRLGVRFK